LKNNNIISYFLEQARRYPSVIAIQMGKEKLTYQELLQRSGVFKSYFDKQNIKEDQRVLILHPLSIDLYAAMLALLAKGCTLVFVEEWAGIKDISTCQQHIKCDVMITNTKIGLVSLLYSSLRKIRKINLSVSGNTEAVDLLPVTPGKEQAAMISFSSGTSGIPKAVIRTHEILHAQFNALKEHIPLKPGEMMCTNFPVVILLNLGLGLSTYLSSSIVFSSLEKTDFGRLYRELMEHSISCLACSPYLVHTLAKTILEKQLAPLALPQIISGGSPFFPVYAEKMYKAFPEAEIRILYGSSEAEPIAFSDGRDVLLNRNKAGLFAGAIDSNTLCKTGSIEAGVFIESEQGAPGEIIVSGDHVVKNYLSSADGLARNKILIDGRLWHRTGDYGYFNEQRQLFLTGNPAYRQGEVSLLEIEKQLSEMNGIEHATILYDTAYVQKEKEVNEALIRKQISDKFPVATSFKFMDLPFDKRHHGKIKYRLLVPEIKNDPID